MVGFVQSSNTEAAEEDREDLKFQPLSNSKKPNDPLELCLPEFEDISSSFPDSFLDFDYINGCFEGNPELSGVSDMADLGGNPVGGELGISKESFDVGCDGVCVKVEVDEKKESVGMGCEEIKESEGLLIEEKLGKVSLEGNSGGIKIDENVNSEDDGDSDEDSEDESSSSSSSSSSDDDEEEEDEESGEMSGEKKAKKVNKNVEMEEGEIMLSDDDADEMVGWSDDEYVGPITSRNELTVLPPVPPVNVTLEPHHQTLPVGVISSIIGAQVIVEGVEKHSPLKDGSILWITKKRSPLGIIDEIFGPVKNPYYVIRYNSESEVPTGIQQGDSISFVHEFSDHILNEKSLYQKGYDASGEHDEELSDQVEFSDDEKEAEYKRSLKIKKRGKNESKSKAGQKRKEKWHQKNAQTGDKPPVNEEQKSVSPVNQEKYSGSSSLGQDLPQAPGFGPPTGIWSNNNNNLFPHSQQQQQQSLGLPPNGMLWMQQNPTPFQLYQTPLQTSAPPPGLPLNFNPLAGQPNLGMVPTWPATIDQNLLLSLQFAMGLQGQHPMQSQGSQIGHNLMQSQGSQIGHNPMQSQGSQIGHNPMQSQGSQIGHNLMQSQGSQIGHNPRAPPVTLETNHNFNQGHSGGGRRGGGHHRGRGRFSGPRGRFQSR